MSLLVIAAAGLVSGTVNAIAGGGSLLLFPVLLGLGIPPLAANVTNSVAVWPGWVGATCGFRAELRQQPRLRLIALATATAAGSVAGCLLLLATPAAAFRFVVPVLLLAASVLLAAHGKARDAGTTDRPTWATTSEAAVGMVASGAYGGYFGGAMGVIMLAILARVLPDGLRTLNAVKTVLSLVDSTVSLVIFASLAQVQWEAAAVAAPACLVGGYIGARAARRTNPGLLRWTVVAVGVAAAGYFLVNGSIA